MLGVTAVVVIGYGCVKLTFAPLIYPTSLECSPYTTGPVYVVPISVPSTFGEFVNLAIVAVVFKGSHSN